MPAIRCCSSSAITTARTRLGTTVINENRKVLASTSRTVGDDSISWYWSRPTKMVGRPTMSLPWKLR